LEFKKQVENSTFIEKNATINDIIAVVRGHTIKGSHFFGELNYQSSYKNATLLLLYEIMLCITIRVTIYFFFDDGRRFFSQKNKKCRAVGEESDRNRI